MTSEHTGDRLAPTRLTAAQWLRRVGNLTNLTTPLGLLVARIGRADVRRGPHGLLLAERYRLAFPVAGAFTVGDVILTGGTFAERLRVTPRLLDHEERHSWQYLCCLGLPFYPVYVVLMGWSVLRTGDRAARHPLERQAGLAAGGYHDRPVIPLRTQACRVAVRLRRWWAPRAAMSSTTGGGLATDIPREQDPNDRSDLPRDHRLRTRR